MASDVITNAQAIQAIMGIGMVLMTILGFFMKRELDRQDVKQTKTDAELEKIREKALSERREIDAKAEANRNENIAKLEAIRMTLEMKIDAARAYCDAEIEKASRNSSVDDGKAEEKIEGLRSDLSKLFEKLQVQVTDLDRQMLVKIADMNARFLPRTEFVRDNTILGSQIAGTSKSIRALEGVIDEALKRYLGDEDKRRLSCHRDRCLRVVVVAVRAR